MEVAKLRHSFTTSSAQSRVVITIDVSKPIYLSPSHLQTITDRHLAVQCCQVKPSNTTITINDAYDLNRKCNYTSHHETLDMRYWHRCMHLWGAEGLQIEE